MLVSIPIVNMWSLVRFLGREPIWLHGLFCASLSAVLAFVEDTAEKIADDALNADTSAVVPFKGISFS